MSEYRAKWLEDKTVQKYREYAIVWRRVVSQRGYFSFEELEGLQNLRTILEGEMRDMRRSDRYREERLKDYKHTLIRSFLTTGEKMLEEFDRYCVECLKKNYSDDIDECEQVFKILKSYVVEFEKYLPEFGAALESFNSFKRKIEVL